MTDTTTRPDTGLVDSPGPQRPAPDQAGRRRRRGQLQALLIDPRAGRIAAIIGFAISAVLCFSARSVMWMDEAQTVAIARRSFPDLFRALREDGSPPLYYALLHGWMAVVGTGTWAVRALSGIFVVAAIAMIAVVARRIPALRARPVTAALLLATSPFVIRYAVEARMYALELLLVIVAILAFERLWRRGGLLSLAGAGVVSGALLLNQYWSIYLLFVVGVAALVVALRGDRRGWWIVGAILIGVALFSPWLPSFLFQAGHTGAPWAPPPSFDTPVVAIGNWVGAGAGASLLRLVYYALIVVAVAAVDRVKGGVAIRRPLRRIPLALLLTTLATLIVGTIASDISSNAYATRYTMVVVPLVMLALAAGLGSVPAKLGNALLTLVCILGLAGSVLVPFQFRTQAATVADLLRGAKPNSLIVFCPDQIGPAVNRLIPNVGTQVVYPSFRSAQMVDWVDYQTRDDAAKPGAFAREALKRAAGRPLYFVYLPGYPNFQQACSELYTDFAIARGEPATLLRGSSSFEHDQLVEFRP